MEEKPKFKILFLATKILRLYVNSFSSLCLRAFVAILNSLPIRFYRAVVLIKSNYIFNSNSLFNKISLEELPTNTSNSPGSATHSFFFLS